MINFLKIFPKQIFIFQQLIAIGEGNFFKRETFKVNVSLSELQP
jgi:hypothetical protein